MASPKTVLLSSAAALALHAAVADASVVVYKCTPNRLCAIDPESGAPRTLIDTKSFVGAPTVTEDGRTFGAELTVGTAPYGTRLVTGSTAPGAAVTDPHDTTRLQDLRPPLTGFDVYGDVAFAPDTGSFVYALGHRPPMGSTVSTGEVRVVAGGVERSVAAPPMVPGVGALGATPYYVDFQSGRTCLVVAADPCQGFPADLPPVAGGSRHGRYLLTEVLGPGQSASNLNARYDLQVRDARTLQVVTTVSNAYGSLSPDDRFVVYTAPSADGNGDGDRIMVVPVDRSAAPRELAAGSTPVWGGTPASPAKVAGAAAPTVTAPARLGSGRSVRLVVKAAKGAAVRVTATAGGRAAGTARATGRGSSAAVRVTLTRAGAARARRAHRFQVRVRVGNTFAFIRTVRVR